MNEQDPPSPHQPDNGAEGPELTPELEARIVALILGELSDFERSELEQRIAASPALAEFRARMESVHGLMEEVSGKPSATEDDGNWKLSSDRKEDLLAKLKRPPEDADLAEVETLPAKRPKRRTWQAYLRPIAAIAATFLILFLVGNILKPMGGQSFGTDMAFVEEATEWDGQTMPAENSIDALLNESSPGMTDLDPATFALAGVFVDPEFQEELRQFGEQSRQLDQIGETLNQEQLFKKTDTPKRSRESLALNAGRLSGAGDETVMQDSPAAAGAVSTRGTSELTIAGEIDASGAEATGGSVAISGGLAGVESTINRASSRVDSLASTLADEQASADKASLGFSFTDPSEGPRQPLNSPDSMSDGFMSSDPFAAPVQSDSNDDPFSSMPTMQSALALAEPATDPFGEARETVTQESAPSIDPFAAVPNQQMAWAERPMVAPAAPSSPSPSAPMAPQERNANSLYVIGQQATFLPSAESRQLAETETESSTPEMKTKRFRVPPNFLSASGGGADSDPFADLGDSSAEDSSQEETAREVMERSGIIFPEGATAYFDAEKSELVVRNTEDQMELADALTDSLHSTPPRSALDDTRDPNRGLFGMTEESGKAAASGRQLAEENSTSFGLALGYSDEAMNQEAESEELSRTFSSGGTVSGAENRDYAFTPPTPATSMPSAEAENEGRLHIGASATFGDVDMVMEGVEVAPTPTTAPQRIAALKEERAAGQSTKAYAEIGHGGRASDLDVDQRRSGDIELPLVVTAPAIEPEPEGFFTRLLGRGRSNETPGEKLSALAETEALLPGHGQMADITATVPEAARKTVARRQEQVAEADQSALLGQRLMEQGDYDGAVTELSASLEALPETIVVEDRRREYSRQLADATELARQNEKKQRGFFGRFFGRQPASLGEEIEEETTVLSSLDVAETDFLVMPEVDRSAPAPSQDAMPRPVKVEKKAPVPAGLGELNASDEAFSTFSLNVSDVSFKLAKAALEQNEWPEAEKIRIEEFVNAFDYGDPMPTQRERVAGLVEQAAHPFLQQRNIMRVSMRTAAAGRSGQTPLRLTLLLDNSGSMERPDRREAVLRAFQVLADQLKATDQITLIGFALEPRLMADQVTGDQAQQLVQLAANTPSEGGTNLEEALRLARQKATEQYLDSAQNRIILLTDGAANLGDADPERLSTMVEAMRNEGIAFDAAGVGADGLNDEILESLTRKGDGRYYFLNKPEDADEGFANQIAGALRPAAKNVKVQVEFNPDRVGNYKLLGFEKHRLNKEDFRNDAVDAAEMAAEEAGVALYQVEAKPDGRGDIGSVSVRFRDMSTGQMVEKRWPIPYQPQVANWDESDSSLRIATAAAMLATKLKGDPLSDTIRLKDLNDGLSSLPAHLSNSEPIQDLRKMIQTTRQLSDQ